MFTASASGREAAKLAQQLGYVRSLTDETNGKHAAQWTISEPGRAHWLRETDPRRAVQALADAIEACQLELADLGRRADGCGDYLSRLSIAVENAFRNPTVPVKAITGVTDTEPGTSILECLRAWRDAGDCPLPVLLVKVKANCPDMTLGAFHDALRSLHARGAIHLHPWTGPLYELPDPTVAVLAGHEIAYYASAREFSVRDSDSLPLSPRGEGLG
jgi:hypothetical protein